MLNRVAALWAERKVCWILVKRDLRVRYARSFLGYVWSIVEPLANALVYFMIFGVIFAQPNAGHQPYFLFLLIGLLPWQWFNSAVVDTPRALLQEAKLVKSTNLPREIWVVRMVLAKGIEFVLSLPVLVLFWLIYFAQGKTQLNANLWLFPVACVVMFLMLVGIGLILAPITVLVNDVQPLIRIFMRVFFYLCPVIFQLKQLEHPHVPQIIRDIYVYNPVSGILEMFRAGFFAGPLPPAPIASAFIGTAILLVAGSFVFTRLEKPVLKEI